MDHAAEVWRPADIHFGGLKGNGCCHFLKICGKVFSDETVSRLASHHHGLWLAVCYHNGGSVTVPTITINGGHDDPPYNYQVFQVEASLRDSK